MPAYRRALGCSLVRLADPKGGDEMASLEQVEISKYHNELVHDVRHLVQKYGRIMGWEVPELDEAEASKLILQALKNALADVEREQ
jgi:hypothetical protein